MFRNITLSLLYFEPKLWRGNRKKILTWEEMNAAVVALFFVCVWSWNTNTAFFLALTVINITSIQSYYHFLPFPTLVLPVLLTLRDGRILMWEGVQLASVDTGYLCGRFKCCGTEMRGEREESRDWKNKGMNRQNQRREDEN